MSILSELLRGPLTPVRSRLEWIARKTADWELREWIGAGIVTQILIALLTQLIWWLSALWSPGVEPAPEVQTETDLSFVEFTPTVQEEVPQQAQDLSDKIIEKEKVEQPQPINWDNAADPTMDFSQRYQARLSVNVSTNDYPARASRAGIGKVTALVDIYIGADGKVKDVRIRKLTSAGGAHKPFEKDFRASVRKIILKKTKLMNKPYSVNGQAQDFVWQTRITFTL